MAPGERGGLESLPRRRHGAQNTAVARGKREQASAGRGDRTRPPRRDSAQGQAARTARRQGIHPEAVPARRGARREDRSDARLPAAGRGDGRRGPPALRRGAAGALFSFPPAPLRRAPPPPPPPPPPGGGPPSPRPPLPG